MFKNIKQKKFCTTSKKSYEGDSIVLIRQECTNGNHGKCATKC